MTLLTTSEKEAARRTNPWLWLLLLGGLALLLIVAALALLSAKNETGRVATTLQGGESSVVTPGSGVGVGESFLGAEDPVEAGAVLACTQFRDGATVIEVAGWFEAEVGTVGPEEEELFRAIVLHALTESCPEVIPGE
jgi:hypothetical protein